jgi:hypothetical protein
MDYDEWRKLMAPFRTRWPNLIVNGNEFVLILKLNLALHASLALRSVFNLRIITVVVCEFGVVKLRAQAK